MTYVDSAGRAVICNLIIQAVLWNTMHKIQSLSYIAALGLHKLNQVTFFTVELGK